MAWLKSFKGTEGLAPSERMPVTFADNAPRSPRSPRRAITRLSLNFKTLNLGDYPLLWIHVVISGWMSFGNRPTHVSADLSNCSQMTRLDFLPHDLQLPVPFTRSFLMRLRKKSVSRQGCCTHFNCSRAKLQKFMTTAANLGCAPGPRQTTDASFNHHSYCLPHRLALDPLFQIDAIHSLLQRRTSNPALDYWSNGVIAPADSWSAGTRDRVSMKRTLANIESNDSLIILKHIETDRMYGPRIDGLMAEILGMCGRRLQKDIVLARATLLIASPYRVTKYHIDADTNFLFQIRGRKHFYVYPNDDASLVPHATLEAYFAGDMNAAKYPRTGGCSANEYLLDPGSAVHVPSLAPHWARNLDDVSIALSINFDLRSIERLAGLYRLNRRLRKCGITPSPPGTYKVMDALKSGVISSARLGRRILVNQGRKRHATASSNDQP